jgi:hypothetical protein
MVTDAAKSSHRLMTADGGLDNNSFSSLTLEITVTTALLLLLIITPTFDSPSVIIVFASNIVAISMTDDSLHLRSDDTAFIHPMLCVCGVCFLLHQKNVSQAFRHRIGTCADNHTRKGML